MWHTLFCTVRKNCGFVSITRTWCLDSSWLNVLIFIKSILLAFLCLCDRWILLSVTDERHIFSDARNLISIERAPRPCYDRHSDADRVYPWMVIPGGQALSFKLIWMHINDIINSYWFSINLSIIQPESWQDSAKVRYKYVAWEISHWSHKQVWSQKTLKCLL